MRLRATDLTSPHNKDVFINIIVSLHVLTIEVMTLILQLMKTVDLEPVAPDGSRDYSNFITVFVFKAKYEKTC